MLTAFKEDKNLLHTDNDWTKTNNCQEQGEAEKVSVLHNGKIFLLKTQKNISCSLFCELCPFWVVAYIPQDP